jgi:hypothetical protein
VNLELANLINTIDKLAGISSEAITKKIIDRMKVFLGIKTMTFDNDQAFIEHEKIAKISTLKHILRDHIPQKIKEQLNIEMV